MATNNAANYSPTNHAVQVGGVSGTLTSLAVGTTGQALVASTGANPAFGTLPIAGGGTNATSFGTSNGIVKYNGTSLIASTTALLDSSNRLTNTSQPVVYAYLNTGLSNVTGDGTNVSPVIFDTILSQQGSAYNATTGVFTAPVTGFYLIEAQITFSGLTALHNAGSLAVNTTSSGTPKSVFNPGALFAGSLVTNGASFSISALLNLTATNTVSIGAVVAGSTKTVGIQGENSGEYTRLTIVLLC
jgi:C1q domain